MLLRFRSVVIAWWRRTLAFSQPKLSWLVAVNSNHIIAIATVVSSIATICYVIYAGGQLIVMKSQLKEMKDSGKQTETLLSLYQQQLSKLDASILQASRLASATETANGNLINADRPWMGGVINVTNFAMNGTPSITSQFINSGKRPAIVDLVVAASIIAKTFPRNPDRYFHSNDRFSVTTDVPGSGSATVTSAETAISADAMKLYESGEITYFAVAKCEYRDILTKQRHWTHVCVYYDLRHKAFRNCKDYNDAN